MVTPRSRRRRAEAHSLAGIPSLSGQHDSVKSSHHPKISATEGYVVSPFFFGTASAGGSWSTHCAIPAGGRRIGRPGFLEPAFHPGWRAVFIKELHPCVLWHR